MTESIIQGRKECYFCRMEAIRRGYEGPLPSEGLDRHHLMHGPNRKKAEKYGLWVYVCRARHHIYGPEAPHANPEMDLRCKQIAQIAFEAKYSHDRWMEEFGKNYL